MFGTQFYPTPQALAEKMFSKLKNRRDAYRVLDPSAGRGDLLQAFHSTFHEYSRKPETFAIETDPDLQSVLIGKGHRLLHGDWLTFRGFDQFDLILMNPPFADGARHLTKALDVMTKGEIVCILNAETLRNPYSNERTALANRLDRMNADISYHEQEFMDADRTTAVDIALIHVVVEPIAVADIDFTDGMSAAELHEEEEPGARQDTVVRNSIEALVQKYDAEVEAGITLIRQYHTGRMPSCVKLQIRDASGFGGLSADINAMLVDVRKEYWREAMQIDAIRKYLTSEGLKAFENQLSGHQSMDFTVDNLMSFLKVISANFSNLMDTTIERVFDSMTRKYAFDTSLHNGNVHYFNGWRTNNAYQVRKKVVLPISLYDNIFQRFEAKWWSSNFQEIADIEKVLGYFSTTKPTERLDTVIERALSDGRTRKIETPLFNISLFMKGTVHIEFTDLDAIRRFNVYVCNYKGWLPHDYGTKRYDQMSDEEQAVVESFEGQSQYESHRKKDAAVLSGSPLQPQLPLLDIAV